jgi:hypothetical protein
MTQTCVDGDRKIPKYLYDVSEKTPKVDLYCAVSHLPTNWNAHGNPVNGTDYVALAFNSVNRFGATFEEQVDPYQNSSTEQGPSDFVNPAILHIESPTLLLSRQTARNYLQEKKTPQAQSFTVNVGPLPMPPVGVKGSHGIESALGGKTIGFTISSGWSSTFSPCGMSEEPGGSINVSYE